MKKANIVVAAIFFVIGIFIFSSTAAYNYAIATDPGPAAWPRFLAILLILLSVLMVIEGFVGEKYRDNNEAIVWWNADMKRVYATMGTFLGFAVLLHYCGFIIASLIFIPAIMRILGETKWWKLILTDVCITFGVYILFGIILRVHLPAPKFM